MSNRSHENNEELFRTAFDLAQRNLSPKQIPDEALNKLKDLDDKISLLGNDITLQKQKGTDTQLIQEIREKQEHQIKERNTILFGYTGDFDISVDPDASQVFTSLKNALSKGIVLEIEKVKKRCVLFLGNESALILGAVCYTYYVRTHKKFHLMECLGLTGNEIKDKLEDATLDKHYRDDRQPKESLIEEFRNGNTLFLRSIDDITILKRLAGIARNGKSDGLLIVSAASKDNMPGEFLELCETINLDPEKQGTPTKETKKKQLNKLYFERNDKDEIVLFANKNKKIVLKDNVGKLLLLFVKDYRRTPEEIRNHIWPNDGNKTNSNVGELRTRFNKECSELGKEKLIADIIDGHYVLDAEVLER